MNSTKADLEMVSRAEGLFTGFLSEEEIRSFDLCISDGTAYRSYEGAGGFMGLAKVRLKNESQ